MIDNAQEEQLDWIIRADYKPGKPQEIVDQLKMLIKQLIGKNLEIMLVKHKSILSEKLGTFQGKETYLILREDMKILLYHAQPY